ncbi:hypothetical protein F5884DRAFT_769692 [Xylogone sp. PMI_703]|nr:hypothetical protein F5884DRAFT_769692 [Xylogone sp. PMI_703]
MDIALSTPELLAAIIAGLPMKDVLVNAMRVNRTWYTTISTFPVLQQLLFFTSINPSQKDSAHWIKNPLLAEKFPYWFIRDFRDTGRFVVDRSDDPLGEYDFSGEYKYYPTCGQYDLKKLDWASNSDAYSRPEASWRRMMVMQPAITRLKIISATTFRKKWSRKRLEKYISLEDGGVRMGLLYDITIGYCDETYARFGVQWNMFEYEVDTGAEEYSDGDSDFYPKEVLVEKYEETDSLTLIWANHRTNHRGTPQLRRHSPLGEDFRSRSRDDMWSDAAKLIETGIYTSDRDPGIEGREAFHREYEEEERQRKLKEENYRRLQMEGGNSMRGLNL